MSDEEEVEYPVFFKDKHADRYIKDNGDGSIVRVLNFTHNKEISSKDVSVTDYSETDKFKRIDKAEFMEAALEVILKVKENVSDLTDSE